MEILILDGGLGEHIQAKYRVKYDSSTPMWSSSLLFTNPDPIVSSHVDFLAAGAQIISTATYQASSQGWKQSRAFICADDAESQDDHDGTRGFRSAIDLADAARNHVYRSATGLRGKGQASFIALSLGPYGATLGPGGDFAHSDWATDIHHIPALTEWHHARLRTLLSTASRGRYGRTGQQRLVDFVAFETMGSANEITAVRKAMAGAERQAGLELPARWWISACFSDQHPAAVGSMRSPCGDTVLSIIHSMLGTTEGDHRLPRPWGVGINCSDLNQFSGLVLTYEEAVGEVLQTDESWPWLVLYPNGYDGGYVRDATRKVQPEDVRTDWADRLWAVVEATRERRRWAGIVVGGCCATTPEDISALAAKAGVKPIGLVAPVAEAEKWWLGQKQ